MVLFSPHTKEIRAKIVYYGPGMCGKTTNLEQVHQKMKGNVRSDLMSVATESDRTIYFDYLPVKLGRIGGYDFKVRTFTVPGQPFYKDTRKMVLQGADGIVFVADSQSYMLDQNKDSLYDLKQNLRANGIDYDTIPLVLQYNKRDLVDVLSKAELDAALNDRNVESFYASALHGRGVLETLRSITTQVFRQVRQGGKASSRKTWNNETTKTSKDAEATSPHRGVADVIRGAEEDTPSAKDTPESLLNMKEFLVLHHNLVKRVNQLEQEHTRLSKEHTHLKTLVGRTLSTKEQE